MARGKQKVATLSSLVGDEEDKTGYTGFPPYEQNHAEAPYLVEVHLPTLEDRDAFCALFEGDFDTLLEEGKRSLKSFWYPVLERGERGSDASYIWVEEE